MDKILNDISKHQECLRKYSIVEIEEAMNVISNRFMDLFVYEYLDMKNCMDYIQYDAMSGDTYKKKDGYQWEAYKEGQLEKIQEITDVSEKIDRIVKLANELQEAAHYLEYNRQNKNAYYKVFTIEMCTTMGKQGFSLTDIKKALPQVQIGDIYHLLTDYMGISMNLSPEEQHAIETENSEDANEAKNVETDMCFATKTLKVCARIQTCIDFGKTLKETVEYMLNKYDDITEEYITEVYNSFSDNEVLN